MRQRFALHLALIFALLFAQQAGFAHALSHFSPAQEQGDNYTARGIAPAQDPAPGHTRHQIQVCAQCLAATLADGAVNTNSILVAVIAAGVIVVAFPGLRFSRHAAALYSARAPPNPA